MTGRGVKLLAAHEAIVYFAVMSAWHKADILNALTNVRFWGQAS
jgi:hypothetical protein